MCLYSPDLHKPVYRRGQYNVAAQKTKSHMAEAKKPQPTQNAIWKTVKPFLNGGLSGMGATCIIQPVDMVKVRLQIGAQGSPVCPLRCAALFLLEGVTAPCSLGEGLGISSQAQSSLTPVAKAAKILHQGGACKRKAHWKANGNSGAYPTLLHSCVCGFGGCQHGAKSSFLFQSTCDRVQRCCISATSIFLVS